MEAYRQKKIAAINDLSGYGRCALTVSIPIISALKVQCNPVPTSILSNHTGYSEFFFDDYTDKMVPYIAQWKKLNLEFDGILTGFLGSKRQIDIVIDFIHSFKKPTTLVVVDPIMGDHGKAYSTYTPEMSEEMKRLVSHADIVTPNLTEACLLTDTPYDLCDKDENNLEILAEKIYSMGPRKVVITGIASGDKLVNYIYEGKGKTYTSKVKKVGTERPGTGDIFASILSAEVVNGKSVRESVKIAEEFIKACILRSDELNIPIVDGVCFEELLYLLIK